jgi:spore coat-associated protein N
MKNKVLLFLIIVSALIGGGYALTQALFSDTETSASNTFAAGTLDMTVDGQNGTAFESINVDNIGVDGTVTGEKEWTIRNAGTVPGNLTFRLNSITNTENGCNEPELVTEPACAADALGELGAATTAVVKIDTDNDGNYDEEDAVVTSTLATSNQGQYATQWNTNAGTVAVPAGATVKVKMNWANDPATYGNEIQSDGLSFQAQFDLTQVNPS